MKAITLKGDKVIWAILFAFFIISVLAVYSSSSTLTFVKGHFWEPAARQAIYFAMGIGVTYVVHRIPHKKFIYLVFLLPIAFITLFISQFTAEEVNGTTRWLSIFGISFQPSEIAKAAMIITTALLMATQQDEKGLKKKAFQVAFWLTSALCFLIFTENFSTSALLMLVIMCMLIIGKARISQLLKYYGTLGIIAFTGLFFIYATPVETLQSLSKAIPPLHRVETWHNRLNKTHEVKMDTIFDQKTGEIQIVPQKDNTINGLDPDKDLQRIRSNVAIASCGIIGKGPGNSIERDRLSQAYSDFIFSIIIEEYGVLGAVFVMSLYIFLLFRIGKIAQHCDKRFPTYLILGFGLLLGVQAMANMAVATGVGPVTGQPLPLVSRGGTSIMFNCFYIGIILSVSEYAKKKENDELGVETEIAPYQPEEFYEENEE